MLGVIYALTFKTNLLYIKVPRILLYSCLTFVKKVYIYVFRNYEFHATIFKVNKVISPALQKHISLYFYGK